MSGENKRKHIRTKLKADVKLSHPEVGDLNLKTGDISDGGAYILTNGDGALKVGDIVSVQVQGLPGGEAPVLKMRIVRMDKQGVGLEFIQPS